MTLTIEITPEQANQLKLAAKLNGLEPEAYISTLLEKHLPKPFAVFGKYADDLPTVDEFLAEKRLETVREDIAAE